MACRGNTKPLCHVVQMIVALSGVSLLPLIGGKSLLLCQKGTHGNAPLILLSSISVFSGILGAER